MVAAIKYAIVRADPAKDAFLSELVDLVDRAIIISGMGERPALVHWREFGLASFTSGSVCVAPRASQAILQALQRADHAERSEERRVGKECVHTGRDRGAPDHEKKNTISIY